MTAVEVTITGTLYDKLNRTTQQVVLIGEASLTGLGIGGGPIIPPGQPPGGSPPGIWGPTDPRPTPPIPIYPGGTPNPPVISGGPIDPYPGHPLPQPPDIPTEDPNWKLHAAWVPAVGWVSVIVPVGDQPVPTPSA